MSCKFDLSEMLKTSLPLFIHQMLYCTDVHPHIKNDFEVMGSFGRTLLSWLNILMNICLKIITPEVFNAEDNNFQLQNLDQLYRRFCFVTGFEYEQRGNVDHMRVKKL